MKLSIPSRSVVKKSIVMTLFCSAISISVATGVRLYLGMTSDNITILVSLILPLVLAFPIAIPVFSKIEKLDNSYRSLLKDARELAKRANTDPLTGLLNRRSFEEQFNNAVRHRSGGIFIIADVDYLKTLNDQYGHLIGDDAIISICHALSTVLRDECLIARIGGDEFCAYVPFADIKTLDQLGEKINAEALAEFQKRTGLTDYALSITIGAQPCQLGDSFRDVMSRSDGELYTRKRSRHGNMVPETNPARMTG